MMNLACSNDGKRLLILDDSETLWEATLDSGKQWTNQNWADPSTVRLVSRPNCESS
jgi:hypothetical protein